MLEKSWASDFYLSAEVVPASWTDGQLHSDSQSTHTSIVTERFSCDQSRDSFPNAWPFVTVVGSIKSDEGGWLGCSFSSQKLGNAGLQHTPGLLSMETVVLADTQNMQGLRFLHSHTQ